MAGRSVALIACVAVGSCGSPSAPPAKPAPVVAEAPPPVATTDWSEVDGGGGWGGYSCIGGHISYSPPELVAAMRESAKNSPQRPWTMRTVDGDSLVLHWLLMHAVVDGPLTFTELQFRFDSYLDHAADARLALALPDGASLSRLARKVDDAWVELDLGVPDPTLVAIAAREEVELIVAYTRELADPDAAFELPHDTNWYDAQVQRRIDVSYVKEEIEHIRPRGLGWGAVAARSVPGTGAEHAKGAPGVVAIRVVPAKRGKVKVDGAAWVWPARIDELAPGAGVMVYAGFRGRKTPKRVVVRIGRDRRALDVELAEPLLVEGAAARARGREAPAVAARWGGGVETLPR